LGFVELGTTFEKETLLAQCGLHLFTCRDWILVLLFWMHLFASVLLAKIGFWYQNVAAASCHSTPTIISTHQRFPNVEEEFSMPATEQWWFWVP
jgi:hypothetical protein